MKYANQECPLISIVSPAHNEQEILPTFVGELDKVLKKIPVFSFEIILVNDGSCDQTKKVLEKISKIYDGVRIVSLKKNVGQQRAILAGLKVSKADAVIVMDCDLQDPPSYIPEFLQKWQEGAEVVYGKRKSRKDGQVKRLLAFIFYRVANIFGMDLFTDTGDFYLLDRRVVFSILSYREKRIFLRGMISWGGYRCVAINIERQARALGKSSYNFRKMFQLALDSIVCRYFFLRSKDES